MASLDSIFAQMRELIRSHWTEVEVYAEDPVGTATAPFVWITLDDEKRSSFNGSFGDGMGTWYFLVRVFVDRDSAPEMNASQMHSMIDMSLPDSIPRLLHEEISDLDNQTTFHVEGIRNYGAAYADGDPKTGAQIDVTVRTPLTP